VAALTRLGITPSQAGEAVQKVAEETNGLSLEELVQVALARLGKQAALNR